MNTVYEKLKSGSNDCVWRAWQSKTSTVKPSVPINLFMAYKFDLHNSFGIASLIAHGSQEKCLDAMDRENCDQMRLIKIHNSVNPMSVNAIIAKRQAYIHEFEALKIDPDELEDDLITAYSF